MAISRQRKVGRSAATLDREKPSLLTKDLHPRIEASQNLDLLIIRHGEAGARMTNMEQDFKRSLTSEGRTEVRRIVKSLKNAGLKAERIYTSPLLRAKETAEIAARILQIPMLEQWDELRPDGDRRSLYRKLAKEGSQIVIVGHEPYLTSMIGEIIGTPGARLVLKKGGVAKVRISAFVPQVSGELRWLLTPKMMTKMS